MRGLEELERICKFNCVQQEISPCLRPCEEYQTIKKELKVNQILKKKSVDLYYISPNDEIPIEDRLESYNFSHKLLPLTLEEMTLVVEWKKEK